MKSLVQYILESYESPSIYLSQRILNLVASMGDTNKNFGTKYVNGDISRAGCYPSLFDFDNDITYEDVIATDFEDRSQVVWFNGKPTWKNEKSKKIYDYLTIDKKDLEYLDTDGSNSRTATGQTSTMYKRNEKMLGEQGDAAKLLRCVRYAFKQMRDGYVMYWDLFLGDPGGACYTPEDISTASVFAFEHYADDEWLDRGTEFEPIFYKGLDDAASDRLPIFICRFFKTVKAAEFWRRKIKSYKDDRDVFIIDFSNPSPEAIKFLEKHKTIHQHKSPGIYGKQYGKRLGVALNEATAMDRLMYLIREFRGEKQKAPYKRDHDFERETVWKDADSKDPLVGGEAIMRKNPNRPKNRDRNRECNCSSFTITKPARIPFDGHDIEVYREICDDCGKETYGFSIDRGRSESWTEGGYKTTDERNVRINEILKNLGVTRKYGL